MIDDATHVRSAKAFSDCHDVVQSLAGDEVPEKVARATARAGGPTKGGPELETARPSSELPQRTRLCDAHTCRTAADRKRCGSGSALRPADVAMSDQGKSNRISQEIQLAG